MENNINNDDFCDIYSNKICDNCGKCLEEDGVDIRAINIEQISKNVEENQYLEDELKLALEALNNSEENISEEEDIFFDDDVLTTENDEYIDAFENVTYIEELDLEDNLSFEEITEEIYPGILKLKRK